ncbi:hypothetical protein GCM10010172_46140 [Paractinoplanes ferrugineus]|uniref:Uncharacterized protein n=1 Tax=Paractinoplanes ferrugineus TaxID=113564 RepID=A0A919J864_9ACTN|nr:hypothetical protein [Actinoplanes ferrugineus]GIE15863.1 hypothetical protein Afe05nite_77030 [Actinoplanes ferrugineus]
MTGDKIANDAAPSDPPPAAEPPQPSKPEPSQPSKPELAPSRTAPPATREAEPAPSPAAPEDAAFLPAAQPGAALGDAADDLVDLVDGAAFTHAPTGRPVDPAELPFAGTYPDVPEVVATDDDFDDEPVVVGFDRRADMWWLITPIVTLLVAPMIAVVLAFFVTASDDNSPGVCGDVLADNGCEEAVLRMIAQHTVAFGILWLGLWALPWYRGLRKYRVALAVLAFAVLLAVPLRLTSG